MNDTLTPNTQAMLLLTAPLIAGRKECNAQLLTLREYNRLARILTKNDKQPADLIGADAGEVIAKCAVPFGQERLRELLGRGFLLGQAVERWHSRAIWVVSRADPNYPKQLKKRLMEDSPPVLYGCGDPALLELGGLAVVGSRQANDDRVGYSEAVGRLAAEAGLVLVSGGAKGIDRAAMNGALQAGGRAVGIVADRLEPAVLARDNRERLIDQRLTLVSPYDPAAAFNIGQAMQRNKLIYAIADAGLIVTSEFKKGGTWSGAVEQLERGCVVPVFVRKDPQERSGNSALLNLGGVAWPEPQDGDQLKKALETATETLLTRPHQESFSFNLQEDAREK